MSTARYGTMLARGWKTRADFYMCSWQSNHGKIICLSVAVSGRKPRLFESKRDGHVRKTIAYGCTLIKHTFDSVHSPYAVSTITHGLRRNWCKSYCHQYDTLLLLRCVGIILCQNVQEQSHFVEYCVFISLPQGENVNSSFGPKCYTP